MYNFSNEAKERMLDGKITRCYLKVLATDTEPEFKINEENYLKDCTFEELRYVPDEGIIGGTVAKRVTGNFNNVEENFSIQDREFELYFGVDLENGTTEYQKYGNFIVQKPDDNQVNDNTSFTALDYMIKANEKYEDRIEYPCTLKDLFLDVVNQCGLETNITSFINDDFIVENNQFTEGETRRDVLKAIAQCAFNWIRIDENNKVVMDFEQKDIFDETLDINKYTSFIKNNQFGPVNVVIFRNSQVEGENITLKDNESIAQYGETELVIADNPFAYTQAKREQLIQKANVLFGLTYTPVEIEAIGYLYLNCKDRIKVENLKEETFYTYLFNHTIEYVGITSDKIESPAMTKTETKYQFESPIESSMKRTEIVVDKANQKITAVAEEVGEHDEKITQMEIDIDSINQKISNITDFTREVTSKNQIHLTETAAGEGFVLDFIIKGSTENFKYLTPSDILVPSNTLVPNGGSFNIVCDKQDRGEISNEAVIKEVIMAEPLRDYLGVYDELEIKNDRITVIRRIEKTENGLHILDNPVIEDYGEFTLSTFEGNTYIYIKEFYNLDYYAQYLIKNDYLDTFATKVELNTSIEQTSTSIMSEVNKKVGEDEFGTLIEQNSDAIKYAWNQISEYIQLMIINGNANFAILDENNKLMMSLDKIGQHFYNESEEVFGEMGVQTIENESNQNKENYIAFSVEGNYDSSIENGMAWGIKTKEDNKFYPILYIKNFTMPPKNSGIENLGELILNGCDLVLGGIGSGIVSGDIKIYGDPRRKHFIFY